MPRKALLVLLVLVSGNPVKAGAQNQPLTAGQWRADLQFAVDSFLSRDRSFSDAARTQFRATVAALRDSAGSIPDERMITRLAHAVALAENAHTRLYLVRNRSEVRRLPVRLWWFSDGLYVVRAKEEHAALLGARVTRICDRPVAEAKRAVDPLYAGNAAWLRYISTYTLTSPELLAGVGVCAAGRAPVFAFVTRAGRTVERALEPLPLRRSTDPTEAWWDLAPTHPGVQGPWIGALPPDPARLPLYLKNLASTYWMEYLPAERLLYLQINRAENAPEGETLGAFGERVLRRLAADSVAKVVVDLRFNTGGNLQIGTPLMRRLAAETRDRGARLFVITGPATFSAGVTHVAQLRQLGNAVIVGEGPGEGMEFWAEGGNRVMPNSRLTLHFADRMHRYSRIKDPPTVPYIDTELYADRITPEIPTPLSSRDYFAGRDPAMEAVLRHR
jgi:hypothetical protein